MPIECAGNVASIVCIAISFAAVGCLIYACYRFYFVGTGATQSRINHGPAAAGNGDRNHETKDWNKQSCRETGKEEPVAKDPPTNSDHENPHEPSQPRPTTSYDGASFGLQILIFIVGCYVACVYSRQLDQMIETNLINRNAAEAENAARITVGLTFDAPPRFMREGEWQYITDLQNFGKWRAGRVSAGFALGWWQVGDPAPPMPIPCFKRSDQSIGAEPPRFLEAPPDHCFTANVAIRDSDIRPRLDEILDSKVRPEIYGLIIYWDGICLRCTNFCRPLYLDPPGIDGTITGRVGIQCEHPPPSCSRYGNYQASACLQKDISDELGYYPASDERGSRGGAGCSNRGIVCAKDPPMARQWWAYMQGRR